MDREWLLGCKLYSSAPIGLDSLIVGLFVFRYKLIAVTLSRV